VFSTTMNNINWSIGLEVTLSVLGFTDINTPTIGVMIYWANQHTALVAGIWWWIFFPVLLVVMTFVGLFLLAVSMNEYIDRAAGSGGANDERGPQRRRVCARTTARRLRRAARRSRGRRHQLLVEGGRDLRSGRRIEQRQEHADQDHSPRHAQPPLEVLGGLGHVTFRTAATRDAACGPQRAPAIRWRHLSLHHAGLDERG
jgi:hypothetical protein